MPSPELDCTSAVGDDQVAPKAFALPSFFGTLRHRTGRRLPSLLRQRMELVFGTDFSDVRIHVGPEAESIGAIAFALGPHIYLAPGHYEPNTPRGQRVLGHELTHLMQQRAGRVENPFGSGVALVLNQSLEAEADRMGALVARAATPDRSDDLPASLAAALPVAAPGPDHPSGWVAQPLVMHGPLAAGGFGPLPVGELRNWIQNKTVRIVPIGNTNTCANYIVGWAPGGGGGTNLTLEGRPVYHISSGLLGGNNGCTVFFTNPQGNHVKIIGVGWHHHGSATRYHLDWGVGKGPWHANRVICTVHGPHCPANH